VNEVGAAAHFARRGEQEVHRVGAARRARHDVQIGVERDAEIFVVDDSALVELLQDAARAGERRGVALLGPRAHAAGLLRQRREVRRLEPAQVFDRLVEVEACRAHHAVAAVSVRGDGEVLAQHRVAPVLVHQPERFGGFADLRPERAGLGVLQPRELHGDGGCPGDDLAVAEVLPGGAEDRGEVDAGVIVEVAVFGLEGGDDDLVGEGVGDWPEAPGLVAAGDFAEEAAGAVEEEVGGLAVVEGAVEGVEEGGGARQEHYRRDRQDPAPTVFPLTPTLSPSWGEGVFGVFGVFGSLRDHVGVTSRGRP